MIKESFDGVSLGVFVRVSRGCSDLWTDYRRGVYYPKTLKGFPELEKVCVVKKFTVCQV